MKLFLFISFYLCSSFSGMQTPDNTLSDAEKKAGWQLLFNGSDLNSWRTYQNKPGSWIAENGIISGTKNNEGKHADLITKKQYENFEFSIQWKVAAGANSGIIYMVSEEYDASFLSGPEYQLIDDIGYPGKLEDWQKSGANYAMNPPAVNAAKPAGEWNLTVIKINKGHVEHWLNDKMVVGYDLWTDEWKKNKEKSKWKDEKGYGASAKGYIALQDHGGGIWFKNIKIKEL